MEIEMCLLTLSYKDTKCCQYEITVYWRFMTIHSIAVKLPRTNLSGKVGIPLRIICAFMTYTDCFCQSLRHALKFFETEGWFYSILLYIMAHWPQSAHILSRQTIRILQKLQSCHFTNSLKAAFLDLGNLKRHGLQLPEFCSQLHNSGR